MAIETLADAASYHAYMIQKIVQRVTEAPAAVQTWRPAAGKWSPLEHLEHAAITDGILLDLMDAMVNRAQARGLTAGPESPRQVDVLPALAAAGVGPDPRVAPAESEPTGASLAEVSRTLQESGARHQALLATLAQIDTDRLRSPLPITGAPANLGQWYHFTGIHLSLHDKHIRTVLAAYAEQHG